MQLRLCSLCVLQIPINAIRWDYSGDPRDIKKSHVTCHYHATMWKLLMWQKDFLTSKRHQEDVGLIFCDIMKFWRSLPHHSEGCGVAQKDGSIWLASHDGRQRTSLKCLYGSEGRKKSWGLHLCISTFLSFSFFSHFFLPVCCPSIFFPSPHHSCLSFPPSPPPPLSLSWCKVMKADVCGSGRARLRDYTASRMKDSWCSQGFVCLCMCVCLGRGGDWKKGTRRDRGKKRKERGGIRV